MCLNPNEWERLLTLDITDLLGIKIHNSVEHWKAMLSSLIIQSSYRGRMLAQ